MIQLRWAAATLLLLFALTWTSLSWADPHTQEVAQSSTSPNIPTQTDDGSDPINLIFTGYAPSWWVAANMVGWSDSAYCSAPKTVDGAPYNFTLEHPDQNGVPCIGPRDHIRIWEMGYSPTLGEWSVASTHHEHTVCDPACHHVIDNWARPEADVRSSFRAELATLSISNYTLTNAGNYQGVFFNGNSTMIQLTPPSGHYPVVFTETGLGNQSSWSVNLNGTRQTTVRPDIVFDETNGTYTFSVGVPVHFNATPSSGTIVVNGGLTIQKVQLQLSKTVVPYWEYVAGGALAAGILGIAFTVFSVKRGKKRFDKNRPGESDKFHNA